MATAYNRKEVLTYKEKWYFHTEAFRKLSRRNLSMNEIMNYYGSTKVYPERERRLLEA